jgi:hypothetical protein
MTTAELQKRIDKSAALSDLKRKLTDEIALQADNSFQFDPFLAVMIISILVQVIIHCREQNSDDAIQQSMRELRTLPPRKLMRLRRRLNNLWRENCAKTGTEYTPDNPIVGAVYRLSDTIDDAAAASLVELAAAR